MPYNTDVAEDWINFVWRNGGGLPIPLPPIALSRDGYKRIIIPPFLVEQIIAVNNTPNNAAITYKVVNSSLFTYPVHSHLGRVRFERKRDFDKNTEGHIEMIWEVCVRPMQNCDPFVKVFTETVINILTRNFRRHTENDQSKKYVDVFLPRGFMREKGPLFRLKRETWLGDVMSAHLHDTRSVVEQIKDFFKPWRWGSLNEDDVSWSDGEISEE